MTAAETAAVKTRTGKPGAVYLETWEQCKRTLKAWGIQETLPRPTAANCIFINWPLCGGAPFLNHAEIRITGQKATDGKRDLYAVTLSHVER